MSAVSFSRRAAVAVAVFALASVPRVVHAQQYFGQNHTQYKKFDWLVKTTEHFQVYYYAEEAEAAIIAAQTAERSYARLSRIFNHQFREKKPIIAFASRGDFAQNNIFGDLGEATGGVTDELHQRNMFFFAGDLKESEHVLAHEMVHQFQYDIFSRGRSGNALTQSSTGNQPLWFIEGMAEFLSVGPGHVATEAIMRDATINGDIPTIEQMTQRPDQYFPYRYGEAFLGYVAKRWGDDVIGEVMQATPASGVERALQRHTGLKLDELGEEWKEALQVQYLPQLAARERARKFAQPVLDERHTGGSTPVFVAPALSPDGRNIVFISTGSFARAEVFLDLYLADATTGKRIKKLTNSTTNPEEELRAAYSQSAFSPDGRQLAYTEQREGRDVLTIMDVKSRRVRGRLDKTGLDQMIGPSFSPDGRQLVFSGTKGGFSDLYIVDSDGRNLRQLTKDSYGDHQPQWSPEGERVAFATERGPDTDLSVLRFGQWRIAVLNLASGDVTVLPNQAGRNLNPMWAPDGQSIAYVTDRTGAANIFLFDFTKNEQYQLTDVIGSVMSFTEQSPAISWAREADRMAFVYYNDGKFTVWAVDNPRQLKKQPFLGTPVTATVVADAGAAVSPARSDPPRVGPGPRAAASAFDSTGRRLSLYRLGTEMRSASSVPDRPAGGRPAPGTMSVKALLDSAALALPDPATFKDARYKPTLHPEYVSRPQVGYAQDNFGRGVFGGTTIVLADMLGNHRLLISGAVNGRIDEAQVFVGFQSLANRFQYQTGFMQTPVFFLQGLSQAVVGPGQYVNSTQLSRYIIREGFFNGSYPISRNARYELGASVNSIERSTEYLGQSIDIGRGYNSGYYVDSIVDRSTLTYTNPYAAYVFDNTLFGRTGPIYGKRMRFEAGPTLGSVKWMHYAADYRRYDPIVFNYLTIATRFQTDLSVGSDEMEFPKYIGRPYYVRGYDRESYSAACGGIGTSTSACAATQLLGSRVIFGNVELRFPILSNAIFGPLPLAVPPVEGLFFYDIGAAWRGGRACDAVTASADASCGQSFYLKKPSNYDLNTQRYLLSSHGFGIRVNAFNIAIIRWDYAIPHDGPSAGKGYWVWTIGSSY